ncbi:hypothetical protein [Butyrivibrio sp. MB2005]|uniref:hypothetical protein n=1 Tax=Butyrivibrio sp. MB2005 TaxID=1280678 RepID=UPI00041C994E|nr:hypothetical protein [Butyrivibrio sp. MB2005]
MRKRIFAGALVVMTAAAMAMSGCGAKGNSEENSTGLIQEKLQDISEENADEAASSESENATSEASETDADSEKNAETAGTEDQNATETNDTSEASDAASEETGSSSGDKLASSTITDDDLYAILDNVASTTGAASGDIRYNCIDDFDGDGTFEGFVFAGSEPDDMNWCEGTVYFASSDKCDEVFKGTLYYNDNESVFRYMDCGSRRFALFNEAYVTALVSHIYYVDGNKPVESAISGIGDFYVGEDPTEINMTLSAYDNFCDFTEGDESSYMWTGHTWKPYYFHYDESSKDYKEYGAVSISEDELAEIVGTDLASEIKAEGYQVDNIYKRENGLVNVNYSKVVNNDDGTLSVTYKNATYDEKAGKYADPWGEGGGTWQESDYGGIYEISVKP